MRLRGLFTIQRLTTVMVACVCLSMATVAWYGYKVITEWQESTAMVATERAAEISNLTVTALTRDMRAVQGALASWPADTFTQRPRYRIRSLLASTFSRYPYPEWFFESTGTGGAESVVFFGRSERLPPWFIPEPDSTGFPVVIGHSPRVAAKLIARIGQDAAAGRQFSIFDYEADGFPYQIVSRLVYDDEFRNHLAATIGFGVNLGMARQEYFQRVAEEVVRVKASPFRATIAVVDDSGERADGTAPPSQRSFPVAFFDPLLVGVDVPNDLRRERLVVNVSSADDPTLETIRTGIRRALVLATIAVVVLALGLGVTDRAIRAHARLVDLRSEFVATVTHELKTPLTSIRAASETLAAGRIRDLGTIQEYGRVVGEEAKRLARLVDNVLAYARITDVAAVYHFEPLALCDLVDDALHRFATLIKTGGVEVAVNVPSALPPVRGDRRALELVLDNIIDNAIRYSGARPKLTIEAQRAGAEIVVEVTDHGIGISEAELAHVTQKFFRGRGAPSGGSGLGLAIAQHIVTDHHGSLSIRSTVGSGTTVSIALPAAGPAEAA
jgi:signal transduction histidine kinase